MHTLLTAVLVLFSLATASFAECTPLQRVFGGCKAPIVAVQGMAEPDLGFVPVFEQVKVYSGFGSDLANDTWFATEDTANWMAKKFGADHVEQQPTINNLGGKYVFTAGPDAGKLAFYRALVFYPGAFLRNNSGVVVGQIADKITINAGVLADEYRRNPEALFPEQHFTYGYPPVQGMYLSNAEQGVWRILNSLNQELVKQKDAQEKAK